MKRKGKKEEKKERKRDREGHSWKKNLEERKKRETTNDVGFTEYHCLSVFEQRTSFFLSSLFL